jgi:hypothetical protein
MNNVASAVNYQYLMHEYPLSNSRIHLVDLIIVGLLKLCLMIFSYAVLKFYFGKPYFPFMVDQAAYYWDINKIMDNASFLLNSDASYMTINTFYSRLLGLIGLFFLFADKFIIVCSVNLILSVLIAIYSVRIYDMLVPESYLSKRLLFYIICLSPMLNVYSLLILRDILITFFCVMFIYYMLKNNLIMMAIILALLVFIRPYLAILFLFVLITKEIANRTFSLRLSWLWFSAIGLLLLISLVMILNYFGPDKVSYALNNLENRLEGKDVARVFALGALTMEASKNTVLTTSIYIRIGTIDSIILPFIVYLIIIPLFIKADKQFRIFIVTIIVIHISAAIAYLTTFNSFTARKLLMVIPLFYVLAFSFLNFRRKKYYDKRSRLIVRKIIT